MPPRSFLTLSLVLGLTAAAQTIPGGKAPPSLAYVYPAGAQQGTTLTVALGGQNLADAQLARITGPGLTAQITGYERPLNQKELIPLREEIQQLQKKRTTDKSSFTPGDQSKLDALNDKLSRGNNRQASPALAETLILTLNVAPDALPGTRELRLLTATGLSNPLVFQVGTLPEFTAPVMTPTSPGATKGKRSSSQQASSAPATQLTVTLPALVNGQILAGEVDRIHFSGRRGQSLVIAASARALIPYLADAVPGWFQATLSLRDAQGRELAYEDDFQFRPDPVLACTLPADGDYTVEIKDAIYRGREDFVYRLALGELPYVQSVFPLGTRLTQPAKLTLTGWNLPAPELAIDPRTEAPGLFQLSVKHKDFTSNLVRFAVGELPEATESEPNDSTPATSFELPATLNGRIDRPDDRDVFTFQGRSGEPIVAEIVARRLDSPLDSHLTLTDDSGQILATNDDYEDKTEGLLTHQADSRLQITLPKDGRYHLIVTDTQHHGGPGHGYRLTVRAPQPDFSLRVTPSAVNLPLAASVPITVFAVRHDGYAGEISLSLRDNRPGYRLSGAKIPAGQDTVTLTLTAPNNSPGTIAPLHLVGTATINGKSRSHEAAPADDTMQAFLYKHLVPARRWEVAHSGRSLPFRLLSDAPVKLKPGETTKIRVAIPNMAQPLKNLKVDLINPPAGVSIASSTAKSGEIVFTILCDAGLNTPNPAGNLIVSVQGQRPSKTPNPKAKPAPLGIVPAIPFEIVPPSTEPARLVKN